MMKAEPSTIIAQIYKLAAEALDNAAAAAYRREVWGSIPSGYPEELELIAMAVAEAVEGLGVGRPEALAIGLAAAERVRAAFGGFRIYIPTGRTFESDARRAAIYAGWKGGTTVTALARQHDLSEEAVRGIIAKMRKANRMQADAFGGGGGA